MNKHPIRILLDHLIESETESVTVQFQSLADLKATKVRLHQLRKQMDTALESIGSPEGIFGTKSILFEKVEGQEDSNSPSLTYRIYLSNQRSPVRARFTIL